MEKWPLPEGWEWKPLGDSAVCNLIMGQSPPGNTYNDTGDGLPFFQGKTDFGEYYPTPRKWCTSPTKISLPGDVLISVRAPVGPTNLTLEKCIIGRGLAAIRPTERTLSNYLLYAIRSIEESIASMGSGSTFSAISKADLSKSEIPIPYPDDPVRSLAEQRRISARLEALLGEVREMRALQAQIEADVGRLMEAVLAEVFDDLSAKYPNQSLGDNEICEIFPGQHILSKDYRGTPPGIGYITGPADFGFKHPEIARWTEKPKVLCHPGDVLFTVKGSGVGKVNCAPPDMDCAIGRQIMALRPNRANLITDYLFYCLHGRFSEFQALRKGAAIPGIRKEDVETISIPVPPRSVQATTIQYLESIQHEVGEMQDTADSTLLDHLEQSILAQAFRGEL